MTTAHEPFDFAQTAKEAVRRHANLFVAQGMIMTLLGLVAVIWPNVSTVAVDLYVGWALLLSGVTVLAMMVFAPNTAGFLWSLLTGALGLFAGVLLIWRPLEGVVSLTLVLVAFFVAEGVFQVAAAIRYRSTFTRTWGWMLLSGIADLVLAGAIIAGWPSTASWALGVIVGVNLVTSGVALIMVGTAARRAVSEADKALA